MILPEIPVTGAGKASSAGKSRPGLGKLLVGAIAQRDYNLIQGGVIVFAVMIMAVNLLVDFSYSFIDPRVRHG